MKIFHLSDLHIGARLYNRDLSEDHDYIFNQVIEQAKTHHPDAMVIAGDIYDKAVPSAEAVSTFNRFITRLKKEIPDMKVMMISGNHDSQARVDLFRSLLADAGVHMIGEPPLKPEDHIEKVTLNDQYGPVNYYLLPFVRPSMIRDLAFREQETAGIEKPEEISTYQQALDYLLSREKIDPEQRNVIVSHQFYLPASEDAGNVERSDSEVRMIGNIDRVDSALLKDFDYAALGHIHKPMKDGSDFIRYSGSPLPLSLSESSQKKGILMVDLDQKGKQSVQTIELHPKRRVLRIEDTAENLLSGHLENRNDYVSLLITDPVEVDMSDVTERLRMAYPNMLDLGRKTYYHRPESEEEQLEAEHLSPYDLCVEFAGLRGIQFSEEDLDLLRETVNEVWGEAE